MQSKTSLFFVRLCRILTVFLIGLTFSSVAMEVASDEEGSKGTNRSSAVLPDSHLTPQRPPVLNLDPLQISQPQSNQYILKTPQRGNHPFVVTSNNRQGGAYPAAKFYMTSDGRVFGPPPVTPTTNIQSKDATPQTDRPVNLDQDIPGCVDDYYRCTISVCRICRSPIKFLALISGAASGSLGTLGAFGGFSQTEKQNIQLAGAILAFSSSVLLAIEAYTTQAITENKQELREVIVEYNTSHQMDELTHSDIPQDHKKDKHL